LISAVENGDPRALSTVRALYPHTGKARVIGFTGPLGVGKSSLINLLLHHLRSQNRTVGVIAVDPSSPFTGGSVLGDRIRIDRGSEDEGLFIRSMATRGHSGGVASKTREVTRLLDAFGLEFILVETVGSGQVDLEIRDVATTNVVVLVPHLGDEVQTLKAGLFEIADVFCVNKVDLPGGEVATKDLNELVALGTPRDGWHPAIVATSSQTGKGISELWEAIWSHEEFLDLAGRRARNERRRIAHEIVSIVRDRLGENLSRAMERDPDLSSLIDRVVQRKLDPRSAADRLYSRRRRA
jgi:LAO/AO transport system kinase